MNDEITRYHFECECNGEIPRGINDSFYSNLYGGVRVEKKPPEFFQSLGLPANADGVYDKENRRFYVSAGTFEKLSQGASHART